MLTLVCEERFPSFGYMLYDIKSIRLINEVKKYMSKAKLGLSNTQVGPGGIGIMSEQN